jgi:hypothetical protein
MAHSLAKHQQATKTKSQSATGESSDEEILDAENPDDVGGGYVEGLSLPPFLRHVLTLPPGHIPTSLLDENHGGQGHWEVINGSDLPSSLLLTFV